MNREDMERKLRPGLPKGEYVCPKCGSLLGNRTSARKGRLVCDCGAEPLVAVLNQSLDLSSIDTSVPPAGAWRRPDIDGIRIGASTASLGTFLGTGAMMLFWNGLTLFFSLAGWGSVYMHLTGTPKILQGWQISKDLPLSPGMTVFFVLFLIPFQLIGLALVWAWLMSLCGHVEMLAGRDRSWLRESVGPFGFTTRFRARDVRHVYLLSTRDSDGRTEPASTIELWLENRKKAKQVGMPKSKRWFLAAAWREALLGDEPR